jgi:SSS family transporter
MTLASFLAFMLMFVAIGAAAMRRSRSTTADYYAASKSIPPWLTALSAVATNNSGYMFIGMIGLTWSEGLRSIWLMIGWITGDLIGSLLAFRAVRHAAGRSSIETFPQLLSRWHGGAMPILQRVSALLILAFLGAYAAAQLKAGGKALYAVFGWDLSSGAILGAMIVLVYSMAGGIRASIWTDAAQSFVMIGAMGLLLWAGLDAAGGPSSAWAAFADVAPGWRDWRPADAWGPALAIVAGWLAAGLAVVGQPHIVIRFMAVDDERSMTRVRIWYYSWFTLFYGATIGVGLLTRLILPPDGFDPELALPRMAMALLPDIAVGTILAGLFAATISTADSLVLACSAALSADLTVRRPSLRIAKAATAGVVALALAIALTDQQTVFRLVLVAWGLLGAAFGPLILILGRGGAPRQGEALTVMGVGVAVFLGWRRLGLSAEIYEVLPAMAAGLLAWAIVRTARRLPLAGRLRR